MSPRAQSPFSLEFILVGLIRLEPIHGYDLYKKIQTMDGLASVWHIKQSQMYALLDKLEEAGYLTSNLMPADNYPSRKQYSLTPAGEGAFLEWMVSPVEHPRDLRQEFLARLYFARLEGAAASQVLMDAQLQTCLSWEMEAETGLDTLPEQDEFNRVVFQFRLVQIRAMREWLEEFQTSQL